MIYDLAIIGGGPAGYTAAERAASKGKKVILFEKSALGGVCLNEGCIPTKTLLQSAKLLETIKASNLYGITVSGETELNLSKVQSRKKKIVRKLVAGIRQKMTENEVEVVLGEAIPQGYTTDNIQIQCNEESYLAKKLILCTGSESAIPPIKGLDKLDYWTSKEALEATELPQKLAIVGGGAIGVEFASFFNHLGVEVSVVEMSTEILRGMDKGLSETLREEYTKKGVKFYLQAKVVGVENNTLKVENEGSEIAIEFDKLLLAVGRRPIADKLNLDTLGVEYDRGVKINEHMQTSNPNVYAVGDLTGKHLLAHTAIREAEVAVNHILGVDDKMEYNAMPAVVYTSPEIAGVGATEGTLQTEGKAYNVKSIPMAYSGRFVIENERGNGVCKLISDEHGVVIGCHILGDPASELIVIAGLAIQQKMNIEELKKVIFPHPSVAEIIREALF